jgi:hypothetical protein
MLELRAFCGICASISQIVQDAIKVLTPCVTAITGQRYLH